MWGSIILAAPLRIIEPMAAGSTSVRAASATRQTAALVTALTLAAWAARLLARWLHGPTDVLTDGYYFYLLIARTFVHGGGLCEVPARACAIRLPLYPLWLSLFLRGNGLGAAFVPAQAALGAAIVPLTYALGAALFDARVGVLGALAAAASPYAVVHDTALQDTVLTNAIVLAGLVLVLRARRRATTWAGVAAGLTLGASVLVTSRVAFLVPATALWLALAWWPGPGRGRVVFAVVLAAVAPVGSWQVRNWQVVGSPVLTTESGESLWTANNVWTFSAFPIGSIDDSTRTADAHLTSDERRALAQARQDPVETDRILGEWGVAYIRAHPLIAGGRALLKMAVPVVAYLSPAHGAVVEAGFVLVYLPIHVAALVMLWRRRRDQMHWLAAVVLLGFLGTTAVFWAHTSHASALDPIWFVYAAACLTGGAAMRRQLGVNISGADAPHSCN
jgi:4-amino-4-deoxy-L-arabinose transferase-like glycosyltransferase